MTIKSPYPYFGGKSAIMSEVWKRLGDTYNFVDPFLGSNAPLLSRQGWDWAKGRWADGRTRIETVNDKDCFVANFWRAIHSEPEAVAKWCDWPVNEADLHSRHLWLVSQDDFIERMRTDPDYYDSKIAGWWVWGLSAWIGGGWCQLGVRPSRQMPKLSRDAGVHRLQHPTGDLYTYFDAIAKRLRRVRVCCGDWARVVGYSPTEYMGQTAVILDPPYSAEAGRDNTLYAEEDSGVAHDVREWAIANGDNPKLRIALFGYEDEHAIPADWEVLAWRTHGGYANQADENGTGRANKGRERVWFSPHCLKVEKAEQLSIL